jgi:hypothetical protein
MNQINENDKKRLLEFIDQYDLDYDSFESDIVKFRITSYDDKEFSIYEDSNRYIVVKFDPKKANEQMHNPAAQAHEYFQFKNLSQVLEQLKIYDESLYKRYWNPVLDSTTEKFNKADYDDNWLSHVQIPEFQVLESESYKYLSYVNESVRPKITSPFNTIHEISPINKKDPTEVNKLYFEIHPISCQKKHESYFVKILSNNEETLKEYVSYEISKKKGLKLFIESIFKEVGISDIFVI